MGVPPCIHSSCKTLCWWPNEKKTEKLKYTVNAFTSNYLHVINLFSCDQFFFKCFWTIVSLMPLVILRFDLINIANGFVMAKSSRGPRQKHRQAGRPFVGNGWMSNSKYTHWRTHTRLMNVRARIPDVPVHVTHRLVKTTLFLIFSFLFSPCSQHEGGSIQYPEIWKKQSGRSKCVGNPCKGNKSTHFVRQQRKPHRSHSDTRRTVYTNTHCTCVWIRNFFWFKT